MIRLIKFSDVFINRIYLAIKTDFPKISTQLIMEFGNEMKLAHKQLFLKSTLGVIGKINNHRLITE